MTGNRMIELYATYDLLEAEQIKNLLQEEGLQVQIRDLGNSPYPMSIGHFNEKRILVLASDEINAHEFISQAIKDEVISSSGRFIHGGLN
ncbi:MAG: DUF2007 domain-containing protein [Nitrospirae bacterium]|nr:DUF2007 domain-containing protein [Nitrospirota bacterium]MBI3594203.1 DUF2007 domain-containing protein [Nitrospirota bacterium]